MKKNSALIIGYGSIGERHARILRELGVHAAVVSSHEIDHAPRYTAIADALLGEKPDYAVISNQTSEHFNTLCHLDALGYRGAVLVEKPLFLEPTQKNFTNLKGVFVGYNLRFSPLLRRLKALLADEKIISIQCYVGKYLPEWRQNRDYANGYSVLNSAGGGVLRDLSHEIDYLNWMCGPWLKISALGGHLSHLKGDSDDVFGILMSGTRCPIATLQMNYLDRISQREIIINTERHTYKADLMKGFLTIDTKTESYEIERDSTYRSEHRALLDGEFKELCSYEEGLEVMKLIDAAETARQKGAWVSL